MVSFFIGQISFRVLYKGINIMTEPNVTAPGPKRQSSNNKNNKPKDNPKENNSAKITDDKKSGSRSSKRIATQITFKVVIRKVFVAYL